MLKKLDINLQKTVIQNTQMKNIDCLIFSDNIFKLKNLLDKLNIKVLNEFTFISAVEIQTDITNLIYLAKSNYVDYISSQAKVTALVDVSRQILLGKCNFLSGENIVMCFIDTGISTHLDFFLGKKRLIKFIDLCNNYTKNYDDNGHGTFVTGVACGSGVVSNFRYKGFANKAEIISIKALDENGEATASRILQAMQWVYDNHKKYKIKVVCMSFGSEPVGVNDPIMRGAEALWSNGIVVVAAAGNSGPKKESIKSPGVSKKIITVGGMNDNRIDGDIDENFFEIADFSSRGPAFYYNKPDLVAPAVDIISCSNKGRYTTLSGTSVATPMIAGIVAQLLEYNKNLKPDMIKKLLISSCKGITFNRNLEGNGYPNLERILQK